MIRTVTPSLLFLAVVCTGCATFARKTPTPAADIQPEVSASMTAPAGERYFVLIFGSQSTPKLPHLTHTWATVVRVNVVGQIEDVHTISWMPATLKIRTLSNRPESGVNLRLHETIREMLRTDQRVSVWGPFEVSAGFYHRFLVQKKFMESGEVGYQCIDSYGEAARKGNACDCIHAITDMDPHYGRSRYPLTFYGEAASLWVVRELYLRKVIRKSSEDHSHLFDQLGFDQYPIVYRRFFALPIDKRPLYEDTYFKIPSSNR